MSASLLEFYDQRAEEAERPASFMGDLLLANRRVTKQEHDRSFEGKDPNFNSDVRRRDIVNLTYNVLPDLKQYRTFW